MARGSEIIHASEQKSPTHAHNSHPKVHHQVFEICMLAGGKLLEERKISARSGTKWKVGTLDFPAQNVKNLDCRELGFSL